MFSAIANYFFGPEKPDLNEADDIDYRTEEEGEWLLVDVPKSRGQENYPPNVDEEALKVEEPVFVPSTKVPVLASSTRNSVVQTPALAKKSVIQASSPRKSAVRRSSNMKTADKIFREGIAKALMRSAKASSSTQDFVTIPYNDSTLQCFPDGRILLSGDFYSQYYLYAAFYKPEIPGLPFVTVCFPELKRPDDAVEEYPLPSGKKSERTSDGKKATRIKTKPYSSKWKYEGRQFGFTCASVNASPVAISNTDTLQQIKELKPIQQVRDYETKKRINKAQLNRHNRAYLYESSNKNKHRRDLWRQHSGANNNRKCC